MSHRSAKDSLEIRLDSQLIPFNKPFLVGKEPYYMMQAVYSGHISGNGKFTRACHEEFKSRYGLEHVLLTSSCTDALEMSAILSDVGPGDEVILPSYTFVSTANAFILRGARVLFADSEEKTPSISAESIERLISPKTKLVVVVHYGGIACDLDSIEPLVKAHRVQLVEDAAHAIDSTFHGRYLGSIGDFATFSFHETKNIICGEGGLIVVNNHQHQARAEIIWEKGTNRAAFQRGEVAKYNWVDIGSSFLPSDLVAAYLLAQLERIEDIQAKRVYLWKRYAELLRSLMLEEKFDLPLVREGASINGHLFYIVCRSLEERTQLIEFLRERNIHAVFHYLPLHRSPFFTSRYQGEPLPNVERFADCLLRLPLYYEMTDAQQDRVVDEIANFYRRGSTPKLANGGTK